MTDRATTREVIAEIRGEMARRGVTQKDLAGRVGISPPALRRRLSGEAPLLVSELLAIAEQLDVEPARLIPRQNTGPRRANGEGPTRTPVGEIERNGQ